MAPYKKSGKRTSFGKQTDAEKAFRGKKKTSWEERPSDEGRSSRPRFSKPSGEGRPYRQSRGDGDFKRPFGKRKDEGDFQPEKRRSSKPFGSSKGKPLRKSNSRSDFKKPFGKSEGRPDFRSGKGGFSKPFRKKDEGFSRGDERRGEFSKPSRSGEGEFKKTFRKRSPGDEKPSGFSKPFHSREGADSKKPFRKTENFGRPYKKEYKKREGQERDEFEQKSFIQKRVAKFKKSDATRVVREKSPDGLTRLNKFISNSGVCSRREADNLITMGLITVNGKSVTEMGFKVKPGDEVRYEGKLLKAEKQVYILLNKPKGFITTTDDPQERNTVMNLVAKACKERVYPVGRLDRNTTGLLLLTNDGELTEKLTHPSYNVKKIYKVELNKPLTKNDLQRITEGVSLEEGRAQVDDVAIISDDSMTVGLEIHIGWNRVVRRIFEALGYEVVRLDRSVYAGLDKKDLGRGEWRFLKPEEVVNLKHFK